MMKRYCALETVQQTVYGKLVKAQDLESKEIVAIKISNIKRKSGEENPFQEEKILRQLSRYSNMSQYCVKFIAAWKKNTKHYQVLEFIDGNDLHNEIASGVFVVKTSHFLQLAEALLFLHSHQICHLDLSLENILIDSNQRLRLCDFGMAKRGFSCKKTEFPVGKDYYRAPEIMNNDFHGGKADVWSLGIIFFMIATSKHPNLYLTCHITEEFLINILSPLRKKLLHLLSKMICPYYSRFNMKQVVAHPFFQQKEFW